MRPCEAHYVMRSVSLSLRDPCPLNFTNVFKPIFPLCSYLRHALRRLDERSDDLVDSKRDVGHHKMDLGDVNDHKEVDCGFLRPEFEIRFFKFSLVEIDIAQVESDENQ